MSAKRRKKRRPKPPPLSSLLRRYAAVGAPVRQGNILDVYESPRQAGWVALYLRPEGGEYDPLDFNSPVAREGQLVWYGKEKLKAAVQHHRLPNLRVMTFSFSANEDARQFAKAAYAELRELTDSPAMKEWIEQSITAEAKKERALVEEWRRREHENLHPSVNPVSQLFFTFD